MILSRAEPETPIFLKTETFSRKVQHVLDLTLTPSQLVELEEIRNGGDLHFTLNLYGQCFGSHDPIPATETLQCPVPQSMWIDLLRKAKYAEIFLFEVSIPMNADESQKVAVNNLRKAQDHYLNGRYEEAIAKCRSVMENIANWHLDDAQTKKVIAAFRSDAKKICLFTTVCYF